MRNLYLLGATGSIGTQALNIIRKNQDYRVLGISFYNNISFGKEIIKEFKPDCTANKVAPIWLVLLKAKLIIWAFVDIA